MPNSKNTSAIEWFENEVAAVKTPKFFLIPRDVSEDDLMAFEKRYGALPRLYRAFLNRYGGASLFRDPEWGCYRIRLLRVPEIAYSGKKGEGTFADIGRWDDRLVYIHIKENERIFSPEILEHLPMGGIQTVAPDFEAWLRSRCEKERKRIKKRQWSEILSGPPPLADEEREALHLREYYDVKKVGSDNLNNVLLEITNRAKKRLRYLTVRLIDPTQPVFTMYAPVLVEDIPPGETHVRPVSFWKDYVCADNVIIADAGIPGPEDRYLFCELSGPSRFRERLAEGKPLPTELTDKVPTRSSP